MLLAVISSLHKTHCCWGLLLMVKRMQGMPCICLIWLASTKWPMNLCQNTIESDGTAFDVNNKRYEKCFLLPFKIKTYLDQTTISLFISIVYRFIFGPHPTIFRRPWLLAVSNLNTRCYLSNTEMYMCLNVTLCTFEVLKPLFEAQMTVCE